MIFYYERNIIEEHEKNKRKYRRRNRKLKLGK